MIARLSRWLRRKWRALVGWHDCPCCGAQALRWHKYVILNEDEPPMFGWWHCEACERRTDVLPTEITERAVKSLGYRNFDEYAERNLGK